VLVGRGSAIELQNRFVLYQTEDGRTRLQVRLEGETVWLSLNQMANLFQRDKSVISRHIKNVFGEGELVRNSVVAEAATTAADGKTYQVEFFNLDVIISVGYRVKSLRGTQFRIWATQRLREYIVKGFTMDDERLKQSGVGAHIADVREPLAGGEPVHVDRGAAQPAAGHRGLYQRAAAGPGRAEERSAPRTRRSGAPTRSLKPMQK
jgi:hypothetical protein